MKSTIKSKAGRKTTTARKSVSEILRAGRRLSPYAFMATAAGVWLPKADAATLVNLDVTGYPNGPTATITNTGTLVGDFNSVGATVPVVTNIDGIHAVAMLDVAGTAGGGGQQYMGPATPAALGGAGKRTIEAWIFDPATNRLNGAATANYQFEKTIFSFGRRVAGGNFALEHGIGEDVGALSTATEQSTALGSMGWNGWNNVVLNNWTYIVATYDGLTLSVYADGVLKNSETYQPYVKAINTALRSSDSSTNTVMRIARQSIDNAAASQSGAGIGPFYLGRLRVQDTNMTASQVLAQYNAEKAAFNYTDSDSNGMADWWEIRYFGAIGQNPAADPDGDGLTNLQEYQHRTNPLLADTDGDGLSDGQEVNTYGTDPTNPDTDGDGLTDGQEVALGTNPLVADTDGDGFSDGVEVAKGTDPKNAASFPAALVNLDATSLPLGPLPNWTNNGTVGGTFDSLNPTNHPAVSNIFGIKGVNFTTLGGNGTNGCSYMGPAVPTSITGGNPRTAELWVYNNTVQDEETVFAWGSRGADHQNVSIGIGRNGAFGAVAQWGASDIGWNNQEVHGRWVNLAYTYDGTNTSRVYVDGKLANSDLDNPALATTALDSLGQPYHFRMNRQNSSGNPYTTIDATGLGEHTVARVRVYDVMFDAATLQAHFNNEKGFFGLNDTDGDGMPDWFEDRFGLNKNNPADASQTNGLSDISNLAKYQAGYNIPVQGTLATIALDPTKPDYDGDGIKDGAEMGRIGGHYRPGQYAPTNPFNKDTDGDGLSDGVETDTGTFVSPLNTGSDPLNADSDGDGYSDGQEVGQGSDPNNAASVPSPLPIISLDATTNYPLGALLVWTNTGRFGGAFTNENATNSGSIQLVQGVNGLTLPGLATYVGIAATALSGNANFSVEAWVYNPTIEPEECIIGWGRRGGPNGTMSAFTDGSEQGDFGCMTHWATDLSWNGANTRTPPRWKYLAYTYNGSTLGQTNYTDQGTSVVAGTGNVLGAPLAVVDSFDNGVTHIPFRIGDENAANTGAPATANLPGFSFTGTIGVIRVYTRVVPQSELQTNFTADAARFGVLPDVDGIPIWWKRVYGFPIGTDVGSQDPDGDGLSNLGEYQNGTDPHNPDTDGDGLTDGYEVANFSNPLNADTDLDGMTDGRSVALGLNPDIRDTDGDGFDDATEVLYGSDPNNASSVPNLTTPIPFVNVDARALPLGPLPVWTNNNALGWSFKAPSNNVPNVQIVAGTAAVMFNGTNYYTGLGEPYSFATNASRTIEAWVYSPGTPPAEQTVLAWSRRGGNPDGSNTALSYGRDPSFGAGQFWATFDIPWGTNTAQIVSNTPPAQWSHIALTYDNTSSNVVVYLNGNVANSQTEPGPLATWLYDPTDSLNTGTNTANPLGRSLPFRIGCQNDAGGNPSVPFAGNSGGLAIARAKAYNVALSAAQIAADYNAERASFPGTPVITNVAATTSGGIRFDWTVNPGPGRSYRIETNDPARLADPAGWGTLASGLTSGPYTNSIAGSKARLYRLRVD